MQPKLYTKQYKRQGRKVKKGEQVKWVEDGAIIKIASRMLEALWKMAEESPTGTFTFDTREKHVL